MPLTETIEWIEDGSHPDIAALILITLDDGDVIEGWYDGEGFRSGPRHDFDEQVIAWAAWPKGARA